jgi:hypothetical protein
LSEAIRNGGFSINVPRAVPVATLEVVLLEPQAARAAMATAMQKEPLILLIQAS